MPQQIVALAVGTHDIQAAVLENTFRDYRVVAFHREPLGAEAGAPADTLRAFVARHHLADATVLSALPGDVVTWRTFFLPFRDRKRLDQTVPFELETHVPFGLDEVVVDYQVLHRDKAGTTVLAALVQRRDLQGHLAVLEQAGLDPKIVDVAPLATLNVLRLLGGDQPESFVFVGGTLAQVTVALFRNRHVVGLRTIVTPVPAEETERLAAGNGQPKEHPERLAALLIELRWTLLALNGAPLDDGLPCLVAGAGVEFAHVAGALADEMGLAVRRLDERPLRNVPPALHAELGGFAPVLGLALREVSTADSFGVNFRRGEFAFHRGEDAVRRAVWRTSLIAVAVVALMITNTYLGYQQLVRRLDLVQGEIRRVFVDTLPQVQRVVDEKTQLQTEIAAAERKLQMLGGVAPMGGATAVDVLRTLSAAVPDSVRVDVDDYVMDTDGVRIKANADSFEAVDAIKQQVVATRAFSAVEVKDVKAAPDGKGVDFRLLVSLATDGTTGAKP